MKTIKSVLSLFAAAVLAVPSFAVAQKCPLCRPAYNNDVAEVKRLLANGADVNEITDALRAAVGNNALEAAKLLIANGAEVNQTNWFDTPFVTSWEKSGALKIAELLLASGANPNAEGMLGHTALHWAAIKNDIKFVKMFLDNGANPNAKTAWGGTALHIAGNNENIKTAQLLLAYGTDINAKDNNGMTVLEYANIHSQTKMAVMLRNYTPGQFAHLKMSPKKADKESDYVRAWCEKNGGKMRARLDDGTIADCLTEEYAVEFDFALPAKSYECAGQALHYANIAKRKPLCILIEKAESTIAEFAAAVAKIPPQTEVRCMSAKGEMFDCPK